ncbi:MAG: aminopeptidase N [Pseudomonadota bacterium]
MRPDTPRTIRLKDYRPSSHVITHVDLNVSLHPTETRVTAKLKINKNPASSQKSKDLILDGEGLDLKHIAINGTELTGKDFKRSDTSLRIAKVPDTFELTTTVIINPEANKALQGLYLSRGIYCTQCEAEGFRRITYFLDRPDILSTYKVRIEAEADEAAVLLSNGNPLERGTVAGGKRHYAVWRDPHPKPCYLFALVGGNLSSISSTFKTMSGRSVDLRIYVEHGKEDRAGWAMESLKRSMTWDEERFGREYDLDVFNIVAVSHFNMGAMENKGLNIFNDRLILASPDKATDAIYQSIEGVVAHEYFHNWTGNRITCRDWFQLCLKEGLTVYRDQEFSSDIRVRTVQRIREVRHLRAHQFPEDAGPLAHPVRPDSYIEINNFYTSTVYDKGAELVRMLATIIGEDSFRAGMDLFFDRHDGDAATIEDFLTCFEEAAGQDLSHFKLWYHQAGTPRVRCHTTHDEKRQKLTVELEQETPPTPGQSKKKPVHIPVRFGLLNADGEDLHKPVQGEPDTTSADLIHLTKKRQKFVFEDIEHCPVVSLFRDFSAPVVVDFDRSDADLEFLGTHDSDGFNRWQAINTLATRLIVGRIEKLKGATSTPTPSGLIRVLSTALEDDSLETGFKAELLKLPSQMDIAREIGAQVDPGLIYKAHKQVTATIGRKLAEQLEAVYKAMSSTATFSAEPEQMAKRALRNAALTLLTARGKDDDLKRLTKHYQRARNMTEAAHALFLLAGQGTAHSQPALDHFYRKWKKDHLVIDTWFAAIGQAPRASALANIKRALKDPAFDYYTPNKVRALVGSFAMHNPSRFHAANGSGYRFFADQIIHVDRFNPQLAARLLGAMGSWSVLEHNRRELARAELKRIAKTKGLSRDTFEIVGKMTKNSDG